MLTWTARPSETPLRGRFNFLGRLCSVIGLALLVFAWLAPNHYPPWTSFHGEAAAFAALLFACLGRVLDGPFGHWKVPTAAAAIACAVIAIQWSCGQIAYGGDALLSSMYLIGACWSWWLGRSVPATAAHGRHDPFVWMAAAFLAGACLSVLVGILQWLRMEPTLGIFAVDRGPDMRVFANLGQPNHLATLCSMATVMAIWLFRAGRLKSWHFALLVAWCSFGITATESRSGLLGALVAGALMLAAARPQGLRSRLVGPVLAWWTFLAIGALTWPILSEALYLQAPRTAQLGTDGARLVMWKQCLAAISASPWWGYGWRQTMFAQKMAAPQVPGWLATDYAHNIGLDLAIWIGVPAAAMLLCLGLAWLVRSLWRVANERQLFLLAATTPMLFHSLFEFPFAYAYFLFPVAWLFGQAAAARAGTAAEPTGSRTRALGFALLACYALVSWNIGLEYLQAEEDYRVMRFELRRVGRIPDGYESPKLALLTQIDAVLRAGRLVPAKGMPAEDLELMRIASERNGWATLDLGYAVALGLNGHAEEAIRRLAQINAVYGGETGQQASVLFREFAAKYPELRRLDVH